MNLISGSTFTNNGTLPDIGEAACAKGVTQSILNSSFNSNLAVFQGGVFLVCSHSYVSRVFLSQSMFDHNIVGISTRPNDSGSGGVFNVESESIL